jgi:hypothetical protein
MRPAEEKKGTLREKRFVDLLPYAFGGFLGLCFFS